ncbi:DNA-directed RNA polymerase subunit H [Methanobrevibacter sp. DSM 116169]|uniref:DNA-directed RNA polymerase subunit H n=1 Tax=Methanobrevibacter sp. DSM 116169 TaxID=3242727 RepID=UPI0038FC2C63
MKIDILKHNLVPKHEVMSDSEIKKNFVDLDYDIKNLPKIKLSDPVVKNIDAKVGDILKITRDSQTAGTFVTYRIVEN